MYKKTYLNKAFHAYTHTYLELLIHSSESKCEISNYSHTLNNNSNKIKQQLKKKQKQQQQRQRQISTTPHMNVANSLHLDIDVIRKLVMHY